MTLRLASQHHKYLIKYKALERNAPCLCGSEKKYKKCCA
ncbi:SEC-C metal-binding domain-containing protein [Pseudoalteromonas sp. SG41-6]